MAWSCDMPVQLTYVYQRHPETGVSFYINQYDYQSFAQRATLITTTNTFESDLQ
jgi:hypothetical protein